MADRHGVPRRQLDARTGINVLTQAAARWLQKHPQWMQRIGTFLEREDKYLAANPDAESPYWGTLCMLISCTIPCWILAALALIVACLVGHPWNWITGAFIGAAAFFTFAACVVWREDRATLKKNGWQ